MKIVASNHKALNQICSDVKHGEDLSFMADEMFRLMFKHKGAGLASNQLGINKRVIAIATDHFTGVIINPVLTDGKYPKKSNESCLSFPNIRKTTTRYNRITITGYDVNWNPITKKLKAFTAFVAQHEVDHLNGIHINQKGKQ